MPSGRRESGAHVTPAGPPWVVGVLVSVALVATGCASGGGIPRPFPVPGTAKVRPPAPVPAEPPPTDIAAPDPDEPIADVVAVVPSSPLAIPEPGPATLMDTALALLGAPYVNGGSSPDGFDCSGFTQWVFARHGVPLPRDTRAQYEIGEEIGRAEVEPGDLLFFRTAGRRVSHVAIALGGERFVHAPNRRGVVRIESLGGLYWSRRFLGARRVKPDVTASAFTERSTSSH